MGQLATWADKTPMARVAKPARPLPRGNYAHKTIRPCQVCYRPLSRDEVDVCFVCIARRAARMR